MLDRESKADAILRAIRDRCNAGSTVSFEEDWGNNTLTVNVDGSHTHVGIPGKEDGSFDQLVDNLYNVLHGGPGLSWVGEEDQHNQ